jgi:hypothetical protein
VDGVLGGTYRTLRCKSTLIFVKPNLSIMKKVLIILGLLNVQIILAQKHEDQLISYMAEFKENIFFDVSRTEVIEKVDYLLDIIDNEVNSMNKDEPEFQNLLKTQKKAKAFYLYANCFTASRRDIFFSDFNYINDLLAMNVVEIPGISCSFAKFYELRMGNFKAILIRNTLIPKDFDYRTIKVDYDCTFNGRVFSGNSINVGGSKVRCAMYLSSENTRFYPIVSAQCSEVKSILSK